MGWFNIHMLDAYSKLKFVVVWRITLRKRGWYSSVRDSEVQMPEIAGFEWGSQSMEWVIESATTTKIKKLHDCWTKEHRHIGYW
jgi:hypothetical protein